LVFPPLRRAPLHTAVIFGGTCFKRILSQAAAVFNLQNDSFCVFWSSFSHAGHKITTLKIVDAPFLYAEFAFCPLFP
jgi:hypothetical protein